MTKNVLVLGGTRFFGKHLVNELLAQGMKVTIATRGKTPDSFGSSVERLIFDREDSALGILYFLIAKCINPIR